MNSLIQKIADALKQAHDEHHAILKYNPIDDRWEIWVGNKPHFVNINSHDEAEEKCESLNYEYAARKAIEALKGEGYRFSVNEWINEALK